MEFEAYAHFDALNCYHVIEFEAALADNHLTVTETVMDDDCGYFCPECGGFVNYVGAEFDGDEVTCGDCDEVIKVSDLKYVPPYVTKSEYFIN